MLRALQIVNAQELRVCLSEVTRVPLVQVPDFVESEPVFDLFTDIKNWLKRQSLTLETHSFIHGKHPIPERGSILVYTEGEEAHCRVLRAGDDYPESKNTHPDHLMVISRL